jgi:hypothetical protein
MRTLIIFCSLILCVQMVNAQKLQLPFKNESVNYEGFIKTSSTFSNEEICKQIKNWLLISSKKMDLTIVSLKERDCTIEVELSSILEPNGIFNDVICNYNILVTNKENELNYILTNLYFSKNKQQYKVDEVYLGYLKREPVTVAGVESRRATLRRHEYILSVLDSQMNNIINSLNSYLIKNDVAIK